MLLNNIFAMARIYGIEHLYFGLHLRMHMFYTSRLCCSLYYVYQTFPYILLIQIIIFWKSICVCSIRNFLTEDPTVSFMEPAFWLTGIHVLVNIQNVILISKDEWNYTCFPWKKLTSALSLKYDIFHIYNACSFECPSVVDIGVVLLLWLYLICDFT